jgi:hypothetical protein
LANVLNKMMLAGYLFGEQTWRDICAIIPAPDFKPIKTINLTGDFVFQKLNADGELQMAAATDEAFSNQIDTFGRRMLMSRKTIIDDDLNALTGMPKLFGIGAIDAFNILFWTCWLSGMGNGPDAAAFWATRNVAAGTLGGGALQANYISGSTTNLSSTALQTAKQTFLKQVKPNGQPLGFDINILLYPPELDQTADELINPEARGLVYGGASAAKQPNLNTWRGKLKGSMSRYLSNGSYTNNSTTAWWVLTDPQRAAAIQVSFLNGQEAPTVQTAEADFSTLGIQIRGFFDPGVAPMNTRAGVMSKGAA